MHLDSFFKCSGFEILWNGFCILYHLWFNLNVTHYYLIGQIQIIQFSDHPITIEKIWYEKGKGQRFGSTNGSFSGHLGLSRLKLMVKWGLMWSLNGLEMGKYGSGSVHIDSGFREIGSGLVKLRSVLISVWKYLALVGTGLGKIGSSWVKSNWVRLSFWWYS